MIEIAGIELLPSWHLFLPFALAGLALNIVPGADMAFIVAASARGGHRDGIIASLGIGAGALFHILAAVLGLSALLASSQVAFNALKWAGAAYLLYIAYGLLRSGAPGSAQAPKASGWRLFRAAMLVNLLNPKVAIFFLAFLPQFIDPGAAAPAIQILGLGLWFDFAGTIVNCLVAIGAARAARRISRVRGIDRIARWLAATILGGLAVQLAVSSRR